jgi:hypothetical protein
MLESILRLFIGISSESRSFLEQSMKGRRMCRIKVNKGQIQICWKYPLHLISFAPKNGSMMEFSTTIRFFRENAKARSGKFHHITAGMWRVCNGNASGIQRDAAAVGTGMQRRCGGRNGNAAAPTVKCCKHMMTFIYPIAAFISHGLPLRLTIESTAPGCKQQTQKKS